MKQLLLLLPLLFFVACDDEEDKKEDEAPTATGNGATQQAHCYRAKSGQPATCDEYSGYTDTELAEAETTCEGVYGEGGCPTTFQVGSCIGAGGASANIRTFEYLPTSASGAESACQDNGGDFNGVDLTPPSPLGGWESECADNDSNGKYEYISATFNSEGTVNSDGDFTSHGEYEITSHLNIDGSDCVGAANTIRETGTYLIVGEGNGGAMNVDLTQSEFYFDPKDSSTATQATTDCSFTVTDGQENNLTDIDCGDFFSSWSTASGSVRYDLYTVNNEGHLVWGDDTARVNGEGTAADERITDLNDYGLEPQ